MAEGELEPWIVETQNTIGKLISKPKMTEKYLKKPPFRFLHDIVVEVSKATKFADGLFAPEEMDAAALSDKQQKVDFLNKAISVVSFALNDKIDVQATKIVAGLEAEKTNGFLQKLHQASTKALDKSPEAVARVLSGESVAEKKKSKKPKEDGEGEKKPKEDKKEEKIVNEPPAEAKAEGGDAATAEEEKKKKDEERRKRKKREEEKKRKEEEAAKASAGDGGGAALPQKAPAEGSPEDLERERKDEEKKKKEEARARKKEEERLRKEQEAAAAAGEGGEAPAAAPEDEKKKKDEARARKKEEERLRKEQEAEAAAQAEAQAQAALRMDEAERQRQEAEAAQAGGHGEDPGSPQHQDVARNMAEQGYAEEVTPRPGMDPGTDFGMDAAPAPDRPRTAGRRPPKVRSKVKEVQDDPALHQNVPAPSLIVDGEKDDDDEDMFEEAQVQQGAGGAINTAGDDGAGHGKLVQDLLKEKKAEEEKERVRKEEEATRETVEEDGNKGIRMGKLKRKKDSGAQHIAEVDTDKLSETIQQLCQAANPLGKSIDLVHQDIANMGKELDHWRQECREASEQYQTELKMTDEVLQPLYQHIAEMDDKIAEQKNTIRNTRSRIWRNNAKVQTLLESVVSAGKT